MSTTNQQSLVRYLPHAIVATCIVTAVPVAVVAALDLAGFLSSTPAVIALGIVLSIAMGTGGAWLWARHPGARDLVFSDLMLWGFLKRLRTEKSIPQMIELLEARHIDGTSDLTSSERIDVLKKLAQALEARDPYTHGHTERVARHSYRIALAMGLPRELAEKIRTAAAVHDVGKIHVPLDVLNKPGKLTDDEYALMKGHSAAGASMVAAAGDAELTALVRHHHERIDGKGYPDRLEGAAIPLGARIMAVADTFDAITSTRSYRSARPHRIALEIIKKEAGTQLDPDAVKAFVSYYSGRSMRTWWASLTTIPQQLGVRLLVWLKDAGVAHLANAAVATGAAVAVGGAMVTGPAPSPTLVESARLASSSHEVSAQADPSRERDPATDGNQRRETRSHDKGNGGGKPGKDEPPAGDDSGGSGEDPGDPPPPDDTEPPPPDNGGGPVDVIDDTISGGKDTVDNVVDGVGDTVDDVVDGADDTVDGVVDGAKDIVDDVVGGGRGLLP